MSIENYLQKEIKSFFLTSLCCLFVFVFSFFFFVNLARQDLYPELAAKTNHVTSEYQYQNNEKQNTHIYCTRMCTVRTLAVAVDTPLQMTTTQLAGASMLQSVFKGVCTYVFAYTSEWQNFRKQEPITANATFTTI